MSQENCTSASPFSALTYQEQQDRWLEWRSRQLDYRPAAAGGQAERTAEETDNKKGAAYQAVPELPTLRIPNMTLAAPNGRKELEQVLSRHREALQRAGAFKSVTSE